MSEVIVGGNPVTIEDVVRVARQGSSVGLSQEPSFRKKNERSLKALNVLLNEGRSVYGVNTGFGDSCDVTMTPDEISKLPESLVRYHGCGLGDVFSFEQTRAIQMARIVSLSQGYSGVRWDLLEFLALQLNKKISPRIPQEGSVGASGDLTPLSYLAASVMGEGSCHFEGNLVSTRELYEKLGIKPLSLQPKESLAIMNGTAAMTGLACLVYARASYLCKLASRITAMNCVGLMGNPRHFDETLFQAKPHPGQMQSATWVRQDLSPSFVARSPDRLQDRYSIRCAPHVIGVLKDALESFRKIIEVELNSANDNPLIDPEEGKLLNGGHFYGGHIAFVMDSLKVLIANVADLLDRQLALMVDVKFNNGLPANLAGAPGSLNHGFKAVQIGVSSWTAEALKLSLPASVFSRSTECHNQDKVSMGTIAARDALRSLQLVEQVTAASLFASAQALELRVRQGQLSETMLGTPLSTFRNRIFDLAPFVTDDRPLESDLRRLTQAIQNEEWSLYC